jgi:Ca2+-transporting ATPase
VMDPASPDVLARPPRRPDEPILGRPQWSNIVVTGLLQAVLCLSMFSWALTHRNLEEARNLAFSVVVFAEVLRAFAARSDTKLYWEMGAFSNWTLVLVTVASVMVQLAIHHLGFTQKLFEIGPISTADCALCLMLGFAPVTVLELRKLIRRWMAGSRPGERKPRLLRASPIL